MSDELLIELVRSEPVLYDLTHQKYMDTNLKIDIWNKIGQELKADSTACKARWNNIRDNYRKSLKRMANKSGPSAKRRKLYKYSDRLTFLNQYFDEREHKVSIFGRKDEEIYQDDDSFHNPDEDNGEDDDPNFIELHCEEASVQDNAGDATASPQCNSALTVSGKSTTRKSVGLVIKVEPHSMPSRKLMENCPNKNVKREADISSQPIVVSQPSPSEHSTLAIPMKSVPVPVPQKAATMPVDPLSTSSDRLIETIMNKKRFRNANISPPHPVDAFLAGIAPTLKSLTPYYLNLVKSEIFSSVQKYELKMLMDQQSKEGGSESNFVYNITPQCDNNSETSSPTEES